VNRDGKREVVRTAQALAARGWVANHDGNVTIRSATDRFLITPTATAKAHIRDLDLLEVDATGKRISGRTRAFGELSMHLAVYRARADVGAVLHAHPPNATAIAVSGQNPIERPFIAEAVVSIGAHIPLLPFQAPGPSAAKQLEQHAGDVDVVLLANHGVFSFGKDLEQAFLRMELVEHLARIALLAQPLGGPVPLPQAAIEKLLAKRRTAGLGQAADKSPLPPIQAPTGEAPAGDTDLAAIVGQEIARALRSS